MMFFKDGQELWKEVKKCEKLRIGKVEDFVDTGEFNGSFK